MRKEDWYDAMGALEIAARENRDALIRMNQLAKELDERPQAAEPTQDGYDDAPAREFSEWRRLLRFLREESPHGHHPSDVLGMVATQLQLLVQSIRTAAKDAGGTDGSYFWKDVLEAVEHENADTTIKEAIRAARDRSFHVLHGTAPSESNQDDEEVESDSDEELDPPGD